MIPLERNAPITEAHLRIESPDYKPGLPNIISVKVLCNKIQPKLSQLHLFAVFGSQNFSAVENLGVNFYVNLFFKSCVVFHFPFITYHAVDS